MGVEMRGKMVPGKGYQPENVEYLADLTEHDRLGRLGRDPMDIPPDLLTKAGHGPRTPRQIQKAVARVEDFPFDKDSPRGWRAVKSHCVEQCWGGPGSPRRCDIIDCPAWAYRMGRNPHNSRRGIRPTFGQKTP